MRPLSRLATLLLVSLMATPALAHVGHDDHAGFLLGFLHPLGGADHVLAMVGVGILAVQLGGRALWLVPVSFVGMMIVGGLLGLAGVAVPHVETGIAASVLVVGALVAFNVGLPSGLATALVGAFAIFHGYAHGMELPGGSGPLAFGAGFVLATALLHVAGIGIGGLFRWLAGDTKTWARRIAGGAMALTGAVLLS